MNKKTPNPIDVHVGKRVRTRRMLIGLSQEKLGDALGVTFQQVQKYEKGSNRISASRLQGIARLLDVPVAYFFEDAPVGMPMAPEAWRGRRQMVPDCSRPPRGCNWRTPSARSTTHRSAAVSSISPRRWPSAAADGSSAGVQAP